MTAFSNALEGFLFGSFNPFGTARRSDYWLIMPLIWFGILAFLVMDAREVWAALLAREVPNLSPFHYGSVLLFVFTLPGRFCLTIRRLHDSRKSARWVLLPIKAFVLAVLGMVGLLSAAMVAAPGAEMLSLGLILSLRFGEDAMIWPILFAFAQAVEMGMLDGMMVGYEAPGLREMVDGFVASFAAGFSDDAQLASASLFIVLLLFGGPPVMMLFFFFLMSLPSRDIEDDFSAGEFASSAGKHRTRRADEVSPAMASYAALDVIHAKPTAETEAQRKAAVSALYRQRILREEDDGEATA